MYTYFVIFLLCFNIARSDPSCCKEEAQTQSYLDAAITMISKAKSVVPSCSDNKECDADTNIDCADLYKKGYNRSGVYTIRPVNRLTNDKPLDVFCDMDTDGGGWTVIQRRGNFGNPDDYFYKDWESYKNGFGSIMKDFWIGNDNIYALSNQKPYSIRFDLQDKEDKRAYANYESFWIDDEYNNYTLHISEYSGNAGEAMKYHNSFKFTTKDRANDVWGVNLNCALTFKGGWWYKSCSTANLNGLYDNTTNVGITWYEWKYTKPLTATEMKIRPRNFAVKYVTNNLKAIKRDSVGKSYLKNILFT